MLKREVTEFDLRAPEFQRLDVKPEDCEFRDDGKVVRKDRWETTVRNIVSILGWSRKEFELPEVVEQVRELAEPRFRWVCAHGCGECDVRRIEFAYETTEDLAGNELSKKTIPRLVSKCCGAPLMMWDNKTDEHIDVEVEHLEPPAAGVSGPADAQPQYPTVKIEDGELVEYDADQPDGTFYLVPAGVTVGATGREPELLQDCDRKLSRALASKPDARLHAREAAAAAGVKASRPVAADGYCHDCEDVRHCGTFKRCLYGNPAATPGADACHEPSGKGGA